MFKSALKSKRCLVIADGFYEWKRKGKSKQPYRVVIKKDELFAMAGIWNIYKGVLTFALITCKANAVMSPIHDRMPVILPQNREETWLSTDRDGALNLLSPFAAKSMKSYKVSDAVNSAANNNEELLKPISN